MRDDLILAALGRLEVGQATLEAGLAGLQAGQTALEAGQAALQAGQAALQADHTALRVDIMARIDRIENRLTSMSDDMTVNFAAVEVVRRVHDTTRAEIRSLNEGVSNLWRQVKRLESEVREIRGE